MLYQRVSYMQSNIVQVLEYCIFYIFIFSTDIDECSSASANECDSNANCTNTEGSYNCMCFNGYSGNGTTCTGKKNLHRKTLFEFTINPGDLI